MGSRRRLSVPKLLLCFALGVLALVGGVLVWQVFSPAVEQRPTVAPEDPGSSGPTVAVWLGDSLTEGAQVAEEERFATLTSAAFGWVPVNRGQGGTGYIAAGSMEVPEHGPFEDRVAAIVADAPEVVVVSGGNNDSGLGASDEELRAAVTATIQPLREGLPDAAIYVVGPFWPEPSPPDAVLRVRDIVAQVAGEFGVPFVDPLGAEWITEVIDGDQPGIRADIIGTDGTHPSAAGHAYIAERLIAELRAAGAEAER